MTMIEKTFTVKKWEGKEVRYYINDMERYAIANLYISKSAKSNHKYTFELKNGFYAHSQKVYNHGVEQFLSENEDAILAEIENIESK